jgi:hypothetical protein
LYTSINLSLDIDLLLIKYGLELGNTLPIMCNFRIGKSRA